MYYCIMKNELLKGTLKTILLNLLEKEGEMYGYEICQKVKDLSEEKLLITEGALYPTLHKLEAEGWLNVKKKKVGKRTRKYYSLSRKGKPIAVQKLREFQEYIETMNLILQPKTAKS